MQISNIKYALGIILRLTHLPFPISQFLLPNSTALVLVRQSGQAKLPSYSVWQVQRRSHFPDEPLTHDFARFWIHVVRNYYSVHVYTL